MTTPSQTRFLAVFMIPIAVVDDWMKASPEVRQPAEEKMRQEWQQWMADHPNMVTSSEAFGKTKRVTAAGAADARNDFMLYGFVEAESHEAAAKAFETHPHLQIPQASIEIMAVRPMGPM